MGRVPRYNIFATLVLATLGWVVAAAPADVIYLNRGGADRGPQADPLSKDASIVRIEKDQLVFRIAGNETSRPLDRVAMIQVTNDPALSAGDAAFVSGDFNKAVENYLRVVRGPADWRIRYAAPRLIEAAGDLKRFDAAVAGYVGLVRVDPAAAAVRKPALPAKGSKFLDDAAKELDQALRAATSEPQKQALLAFQLDIHQARSDEAASASTLEQLLKVAGGEAAKDPANAALLASIRLSQARIALTKKQPADAAKVIESHQSAFADPTQQAEALYMLAQAKEGLAKEGLAKEAPAGEPQATDIAALQDAALAYMKVVAHFARAEGSPFVADSLLRAAQLQEKINDVDAARAMYAQLSEEFPDSPAAGDAKQALERLK